MQQEQNQKEELQYNQNEDIEFDNKFKNPQIPRKSHIKPETENPKKIHDFSHRHSKSKNLDEVENKFPIGDSNEDELKRKELWKQFDFSGNGNLTLNEIQANLAGIKDFPKLLVNEQLAISCAFQDALQYHDENQNQSSIKQSKLGNKNVLHFQHFQRFLIYIDYYVNYLIWFNEVDKDKSGKLSFEEFKQAEIILEQYWLININCKEEFQKIDKDDSGKINFHEFAIYCIEKTFKLQKEKQQQKIQVKEEVKIEEVKKEEVKKEEVKKEEVKKEEVKKEEVKKEEVKKEEVKKVLNVQPEIQTSPQKLQQVNQFNKIKTKQDEFIDEFQNFFQFAYATSQLISHEQLNKFTGASADELGILIVRILPFLGENLNSCLLNNLKYINDKQILKSSLNFTSAFKNFKEIQQVGQKIAEKFSKELKQNINNATLESPYIVDWIDKIKSLSKQTKIEILQIEGVDEMFDTPVKQYANKICCYFIGNWITSGILREQYFEQSEEKIQFVNDLINTGRYKERFVLKTIEEQEKEDMEKKKKLILGRQGNVTQDKVNQDKVTPEVEIKSTDDKNKIPLPQTQENSCCILF